MAELIKCKSCENKGDLSAKTCPSCGCALIKTWVEQIIDTMTPAKLARWLLWMGGIAFLIILLVLGFYWGHFGDLSSQQKAWGEFGDYFGGTLNPILSFLSLMALLCTIVLQSKELELTRDELKRSASAQEATKSILEKQSETLARQQFESTFFSLLDQHNKVLEFLTHDEFETSPNRIGHIQKFIFDNTDGATDLASAKAILKKHKTLCGHYFRILYQLLKFVATNSPGSTIGQAFEVDKIQSEELTVNEKMYSNIVRSLLNNSVTQLLSINCYCTDPNDTYWRYKLLIERYEFLEHMPFEIYGTNNPIFIQTRDFYEASAFGDSDYLKELNRNNVI